MRSHTLLNLGPHGFHRTRYHEWGDPANPRVVVCVHGLTRNGRGRCTGSSGWCTS